MQNKVIHERPYDIILWGATSFVGKLITQYLIQSNEKITWAIAGRQRLKLEALKASLGECGHNLSIMVGDAFDYNFLLELTSKTRLVMTTVGPYLKYGESLVSACVETGTDYCDLTGEVPFIRMMLDKYQSKAVQNNARIIHCAGFDSIPSDLGVYMLNQHCVETFNGPMVTCEMQVKSIKGGLSGGTIASGIEIMRFYQVHPDLIEQHNDPYALCPTQCRDGVQQPPLKSIERSTESRHWCSSFFMAPVNTKIVHRTNALLQYPYSKQFLYSERLVMRSKFRAYMSEAIGSLYSQFLEIALTRWILQRFFLPKPGEGPSVELQLNGHFVFQFYGSTSNGKKLSAIMTGDRDPGYGATAKIMSEAALCLLFDVSKEDSGSGFLTPASAMGAALMKRLTQNAGVTFAIDDSQ